MNDPELAAMEIAYTALRGMDPAQWNRALQYVADRLGADDRAQYATRFDPQPEPAQFAHASEMETLYDSADELVKDYADNWVPYEVCGISVTSQRFAVIFPIGANGEVGGHEIEWFDTRDAADAFVRDRT